MDYQGEEVKVARSVSWDMLAPALPSEVGTVSLADVCDAGCKHYVENFENYLLPVEDQVFTKGPKVMVPPGDWEAVASNLIQRGICKVIEESEVYHVQDKPLLNGLFGVSKGDWHGDIEVHRLIMNLIPLNRICRGSEGDIATLPSWSSMGPLSLDIDEDLLISSEDVRCFFYIFKVPFSWHRFMAFNRPLPSSLCQGRSGTCYLAATVLPMGFKNSVSIAQHVHRFVLRQGLMNSGCLGRGDQELRRDRPFPTGSNMFRIYLDNFDELTKVNKSLAATLKGELTPTVLALQEEYARWNIPRHPKKAVALQPVAEVQGAVVDGERGVAYPKVDKILKYVVLGLKLAGSTYSTQRQAQIVGGGFVYMTMFRRPLLSALNHIWAFIKAFEGLREGAALRTPELVKMELLRFVGLVPLAHFDFRTEVQGMVTASDASCTGGGVTRSKGLSPWGIIASQMPQRGDLPEPFDVCGVVTIGLFDGIGALRVAAEASQLPLLGHIAVEKNQEARRVTEARYPASLVWEDVSTVDAEVVKGWSTHFSQASLIVIGAGPPCQGVSGLNADRKGALKDKRSCLFTHVPRIVELVKQAFPWCQVRLLMESVASMDDADRLLMSASVDLEPIKIDAAGVSVAHRPRLYWFDWEVPNMMGVRKVFKEVLEIELTAEVDPCTYMEQGWSMKEAGKLPTFTTSRPRSFPGHRPAGLNKCSFEERQRWENDMYRFPPYQYRDCYCLTNRVGEFRLPNVREREAMMGFPVNYTESCLPKSGSTAEQKNDARLTLIGNSWNVTVITFLLSCLGSILGLCPQLTPSEAVEATKPGTGKNFMNFLQRPPLTFSRKRGSDEKELMLAKKFMNHVSLKGEDILVHSSAEEQLKFHRLRASIPSQCWRWQTVASWGWKGDPEHINCMELRAILTSIRWWIEKRKVNRAKFIHLTDSLVCMHCLARGRTSSRKLRRTLTRINCLLLASRSFPVWAYVHTSQNPADRPSRRCVRKKWVK